MKDGEWNAGLTTTAGFTLGVVATVLIATTSINSGALEWSDWLQFAGTLIGAGATIGAGVAAWLAVHRQINAPTDRAVEVIFRYAISVEQAASDCGIRMSGIIKQKDIDEFLFKSSFQTYDKYKEATDNLNNTILNEPDIAHALAQAPAQLTTKCRAVERSVDNLRKMLTGNSVMHSREVWRAAETTRKEAGALIEAIKQWEVQR